MERGHLEKHEIFLSGLHVSIRSSCSRTNRYIRRHWSAAASPIIPPDSKCDIEVIADESPRISLDGEIVWADDDAESLVAGFEERLYRLALARHKRRLSVFHAAAVVSDEATVVFSGPSGAGKSSLALAAVRRGWRYFSDEFVVTDGLRVWGWPRAIRFDAPEAGVRTPDYLEGLDRDEDALVSEPNRAPPYYLVPDHALQRTTCPARDVRFIRIEPGETTELTRVSTSVGLAHWTEASFFEPPMSLGALVGLDRTWHASWHHPDALIDLLEIS